MNGKLRNLALIDFISRLWYLPYIEIDGFQVQNGLIHSFPLETLNGAVEEIEGRIRYL